MVYVTQSNGHNLTQAEHFGEIRFVALNSINPRFQDRMVYDALKVLRFFRPEEDYLLVAGQRSWETVCVWALTMLCPSGFRVLLWDNKTRQYVEHDYTQKQFHDVLKRISQEGLTEQDYYGMILADKREGSV